ncbi:hypothetical protein [Pyrobaculum aerophilum]|uniref:Uncharacterized protein n=1 Tax=Pyrobaculum aerophilum TaxID=13773 RepID=A0A371R262_9CREN|nr:hypothetical protein [Pyrobaculum aerophilum]RFA97618.1 hypothetical protein CGL52_08800 [Pyrobaculum aerophilum]RFA98056.1 hypothetical protein CGL51_01545 [Pyrobaculum aerophilum]
MSNSAVKIISGLAIATIALILIGVVQPMFFATLAMPSLYNEEVIYRAPAGNLEVNYVSSPFYNLGNETALVIEVVDEREMPVNFTAFLSGPGEKGFVEVGKASGRGKAKVNIGKYVAEAKRLAKKLGWKPNEVGIGLVAFITAVEKEDNETHVLTDVVTIPIIPGKAVGKEVVAKVKFKPIIKHKINATGAKEARQSFEGPGQTCSAAMQSPPSQIDYGCMWEPFGCSCWKWELAETVYTADYVGIPAIITYLDGIDGYYTDRVDHIHFIVLDSSYASYISFDMSMKITSNDWTISPGLGFSIPLGSTQQRQLFDFNCIFRNDRRYPGAVSDCHYFGNLYATLPTFQDSAILATGFIGTVYVVKYELVHYVCSYFCFPCGRAGVVDAAYAVFMAPISQDGKFMPWFNYDDYPYDGSGYLEAMYNLLTQVTSSDKLYDPPVLRYSISPSAYNIISDVQSNKYFAIGIPIGALIKARAPYLNIPGLDRLSIGVEIGSISSEFYASYAKDIVSVWEERCFEGHYYKYSSYYIRDAGDFYPVPTFVLWPWTTSPVGGSCS